MLTSLHDASKTDPQTITLFGHAKPEVIDMLKKEGFEENGGKC